MVIESSLSITGLGALSALGTDIAAHQRAVLAHEVPFQALGKLLGNGSAHARRPAAWIENRSALTHRKWSPVSMAALHVARDAISAAGWSDADLKDAALVVGTSRGNAAGWLGEWPGRRPFKLMAASNTIHSEPATAISIEFGITGPNHVLASGCSAGLDALGIAAMMVRTGLAPRALAVAVDLPLVPLLLDNYAASGLLCEAFKLDPYARSAQGFIPGEGAAAVAIEQRPGKYPQLLHYGCNADACDPVGIPRDGGRSYELIEKAIGQYGSPAAIGMHATGTQVQAVAEEATLRRVFKNSLPTLHLLKPLLGHTIGASGLLETAIMMEFLKYSMLPPNLPGLHAPDGFTLPEVSIAAGGPVIKLAHGMGGHNSLVVLKAS